MTSIILLLFIGLLALVYLLFKQNNKMKFIREALENYEETEEVKIIKAKLEGRDEERARIAKDWHDGIGNSLSTLRLIFDNIQPRNPETHTEARTLLEHTLREFRQIIDNELDNTFSDEEAIINTLKKWQRQLHFGNINFIFNVYALNDYATCSLLFKSYLYRIVQELITNTLKHANATRIELNLKEEAGKLTLTYTDNGKGFTIEKLGENDLRSLKERLKVIEGKLELKSRKSGESGIEIIILYK